MQKTAYRKVFLLLLFLLSALGRAEAAYGRGENSQYRENYPPPQGEPYYDYRTDARAGYGENYRPAPTVPYYDYRTDPR